MEINSKKLGQKLKSYRQSANKDIKDIAEAIESDTITITKIESGQHSLDEETLALLISHFKLDESQATELWKMAGYEAIELDGIDEINIEQTQKIDKKQIRISLPSDVKVLYSDMAQVISNEYGVVLQFIQTAPGNNAIVISRIGMSSKHAQSFAKMLQQNIDSQDESTDS